jgi:hypothetical protein
MRRVDGKLLIENPKDVWKEFLFKFLIVKEYTIKDDLAKSA